MIRVVLFLALAGAGLDYSEDLRIKRRLDDLKPPQRANALRALNEPPSPPVAPPLPPLYGVDGGVL